MEAVIKALENGGASIGVNMKYGYKERKNEYLTRSLGFQFPYIRKFVVTAPSKGFVFFPGGFGTLHQLFEVLTLLKTKKMQPLPVLLYDHDFWEPLLVFIKKIMYHELNAISDEDDELFQIVDSVDTAVQIIKDFKESGFIKK